ncbi:MAG TPA: RDD family protein [Desulfobaccales bacterium]|jgi:uncharacterized RDD family membrane protein YckC
MEAYAAAEPWKRWGAFLIDIVIVYLQSIILLGLASAYYQIKLNVVSPNHMIMSITIFLLIGWAYFAIAESSQKQATVGKRVLGIIVTDLEGKRISLMNATRRFWVKVISGFLFAAVIMKKRALHDEFSGSLVINKVALAPSSLGRKPPKAAFA